MKEGAEQIGVLGGTFDPVHWGHLHLAREARDRLTLDRVLFVPAASAPHKQDRAITPARHRLAMLRRAVAGERGFEISDVEVRRGGVSFTVDTLRALRAQSPKAALHFLIGADSLRDLHLWKDVYAILGLCQIVTFARPGAEGETPAVDEIRLRPPWPQRLAGNILRGRCLDISSTDIRRRAAAGQDISSLVPPAVAAYICEQKLYPAQENRPSTP